MTFAEGSLVEPPCSSDEASADWRTRLLTPVKRLCFHLPTADFVGSHAALLPDTERLFYYSRSSFGKEAR
jgi:hypothetical protein